MVLRFLLGFLASPCLATVVASYADIWGESVPIAIGVFAAVASLAPALGPVISAFAVQSMGWQFWAWELLAIAGPAWLLMLFMVPETAAPTILYYRAKQLRSETGDKNIMSESEIKHSQTSFGSSLWFALVKPWEINIKVRLSIQSRDSILIRIGSGNVVCDHLHRSFLRPCVLFLRGKALRI
jgi:MFS transporter, DHA1 family, multidrug resistance protein